MAKKTVLMRWFAGGALKPGDRYSVEVLKEMNFKIGDDVVVELKKPRNLGYWRLMHVFGELVVQNIDGFENMTPHDALKRIQLEADIECDHMIIQMEGENLEYRIPRSMSFIDMDQVDIERVYKAMARHVVATYWPEFDDNQALNMIQLLPGD